MCGIAGYLSKSGQAPDGSRMLRGLRHRGPDGEGQWTSSDGRVWFGHARLSILDLTDAGAQPMKDEASGNVIIFNGEIYNHLDLRRELEEIGVRFRGHSDTETLLRGYAAWGTAIFPRLRGMFALAIYDAGSREVILCRDRFGIKPLYVGRGPGDSLLFCSEVRPMLSFTGKDLSPEGLSNYLHWGACTHGELLFSNLREFPSGCWARCKPGRPSFDPVRYWPTRAEEPVPEPNERRAVPSDRAAQVRALLEDAVRSHLLSDVPVACFLSGGIDSSVITAIAARELGSSRLATFSVGFSEAGFDESKFARQMAELYGTDHHHIHLNKEEQLAYVRRAVAAMDLPSIDAANTFIVSDQVARGGYKVVLSGLGADEVFGGYPIFRDFSLARAIAGTPGWLRALVHATGRGGHILDDIPATLDGESLSCWWRRVWSGEKLAALGLAKPDYKPEPGPDLQDAMSELSWGEISHYMRDMLLRDSDTMSMANSIELRVPFLDNDLVSTVLACPAREKFDPRLPKKLLLRATEDLLPEQIWNRPKMGFSLPMSEWMAGSLAEYCRAGLEGLAASATVPRARVDETWQDFLAKRARWPNVWSLVVLGHYLQARE